MIHLEYAGPWWAFVLGVAAISSGVTFASVVFAERVLHYRTKRRIRKRLQQQLASPDRTILP